MTLGFDDLYTAVSKWLATTGFSDAFILGSLVHGQGARGNRQLGHVDVICLFKTNDGYLQKWRSVISASSSVLDLNLALLKCLGRNNAYQPVASVFPVSEFELNSGLHKDKAPQFFSHNEFISVTNGVSGPIGKEHVAVEQAIEGALDSIREAQCVRNKMLAISPTGSRQLGSYDGPDVLPKAFTRCAAQTRWALVDGLRSSDSFDVNEGILYTLQLLTARRREAPEVNELLKRVLVRMGGRGRRSALDSHSQMLLWEILAEDASSAIASPLAERSFPEVPKKKGTTHETRRHLSNRRALRSQELTRQVLRPAGYSCAYPGCGVPLGDDGIGQIAPVRGARPDGPRYEPSLRREDGDDLAGC